MQPSGDNGIGLDGPTAGKTYYYGESYVAQLDLAPNALVMLNHLCYASGNSEGGRAKLDHLTVAMAHTRIDGYGAGFIRAGAKAVIAEGLNDLSYYVNTLFSGGSMTVDQMWRNAGQRQRRQLHQFANARLHVGERPGLRRALRR